MIRASELRLGDTTRDGEVLAVARGFGTTHGKPTGRPVIVATVRSEAFPFSPAHPSYRWVSYPPDMVVT